MNISDKGIEQIKKFEGVKLTIYKDTAGIYTVGVGHAIQPKGNESKEQALKAFKIKYNLGCNIISKKLCDELLKDDLRKCESCVTKYVTVPLKQYQFDMLVSFVFNVGESAFKNSTLLKYLNKGDILKAKDQLLLWNKITVNGKKIVDKGLANRREKEYEIFTLGY